jgi:hypothetical protein
MARGAAPADPGVAGPRPDPIWVADWGDVENPRGEIGEHAGSCRTSHRSGLWVDTAWCLWRAIVPPARSARACLCGQLQCVDGGNRGLVRGCCAEGLRATQASPGLDATQVGSPDGGDVRTPCGEIGEYSSGSSHTWCGAAVVAPASRCPPGRAMVLPARSARACLCGQLLAEDGGIRAVDRRHHAEGLGPTRGSAGLDTTQVGLPDRGDVQTPRGEVGDHSVSGRTSCCSRGPPRCRARFERRRGRRGSVL